MAIAITGITPSGTPHVGNYLGMLRPTLRLAREHETLCFVSDLHALIKVRDPEAVRTRSRELAAMWLAFGLDPSTTTLYRQSDVPEICEAVWLLSCVTAKGELNRAHAYKAAVAANADAGRDPDAGVTAGLYGYPVLMAADILIYDSDVVPVGKDQKQHIEITRDLAVKMNETFGQSEPDGRIFKLPEARIQSATETVPGIDGQKMSKSYGNNIDIFGDEKEIRKRVMSIVTDSTPVEAPKDPAKSTIFKLYSLVSSEDEIAAMREEFLEGGIGYGDFKKQLFERLWDYFAPMRKRREEILADKSYIDNVLEKGAIRANEIADQIMKRVRKAVGLR
jgi:tryptophanyl-tRNA synthetase